MRFLHTADWHIGRPFAVSRLAEQEAVLAEILDIASANRVDCVLVCGDIFDSRTPSAEAERAVFTFFAELVKRGMAAIAIAGNHDHPKRLDALRGLLDPLRIFIRTEPAPGEQGGVVEFTAGGEVARIAALPYVSERRIVDACKLMGPEETWYSDYRENVAAMMNLLTRSFTASTINIVMGHMFAVGAETSGSEWRIHTSLPYEIHPARFPPAAQYIALGDLHRPQEIAGPVPCRYSGSPIQLDFGEQGQRKSVVLVEAHPGRPVHIETIPLTAGRNLREIEGTIDEIEAQADQLSGDYLKATVITEGPVPGLAERVRSRLPDTLQIRTKSAVAGEELTPAPRPQGKPEELFQDFYKRQHGGEPGADLLKAFGELYQEAIHAPSKLTLEGFTSFRQRTEIDFTGLDLFAITGPTGSGKTSVLDAITYALYAQTTRLGSRGTGELITHGAPRLSVLLEFEVAGRRHRVARALKRGGSPSARLETLEEGDWRPFDGGARDITAEIEKIVGLDFDAFSRAVLLPQGEFDEFLRGEKAQRRDILKALLNLEVYDSMMKVANTRAGYCRKERDLICVQLESEYADATEENLEAISSDIEKLDREAEGISAQTMRVEELRPEVQDLRQKREFAANSERDRADAEQELAREHIQKAGLAGRIGRYEEEIHRLEQGRLSVPYDETLHQRLIACKPVAEELEKVERDRAIMAGESGAKSKDLRQVELKSGAAENEYGKLVARAVETEKGYAVAEARLGSLREKHGSADMAEQVAREAGGLGALQRQLKEHEDHARELEDEGSRLARRVEKLKTEEALARQARDEAQQIYESLLGKHSAAELRKHLQKGEPCPVCEQVVPKLPRRIAATDLEQAKAEREKCRQVWQAKQGELVKTEAELDALPSRIELTREAAARIAKQIAEIQKKAEGITAEAFSKDTPAALKRIGADLRAAESDVKSKQQDAKKAAEATTKAKDALADLEQRAAVLREAIKSFSERIAKADDDIKRLLGVLAGAGDAGTIRAALKAQQEAKRKREEIEEKIEETRKERDKAEKERSELNLRIAGLEGKIEALSKNRDEAGSAALRMERSLKSKLAGIALPEGRDEAERIDKLLAELRDRHSELKRELARNEVRLDQLRKRIAEAKQKRARVGELEQSVSIYGKLGMLLKADQFIRFILEGAFDLLCREGTRQLLTLSQGRYSFHSEDDDFAIIDHLNADERRSVRTLSGGESFLASLALALALASSVSQFSESGPIKLDALFLDEGFSTLDAETLNVAIDALQALQAGDRMIGVVSHVPDLAERLPGRIQIVKGIAGSEINLEQTLAAANS